MNVKKVDLQGAVGARAIIRAMIARGEDPTPLFRQIAGIMDDEVEENFQAGGRDPEWPESQRVKKHGGQTLTDSAQLRNSIQQFVTATSAGLSTNKEHAAIHNFGGDIEREPRYTTVRLRTDAKGNLLRQGVEGLKANLAVFARASHKRVATRTRVVRRYTIHMPQREFMKISAAGTGKIEAAAARFIVGG